MFCETTEKLFCVFVRYFPNTIPLSAVISVPTSIKIYVIAHRAKDIDINSFNEQQDKLVFCDSGIENEEK